jgi:hypothetical protein
MSFYIVTLVLLVSFYKLQMTYAEQSFISEQCNSETLALALNDTDLDTIFLVMTDESTYDLTQISASYRDSCLNAGGQLYTTDISLDCAITLHGETHITDYNYLNYPRCVGKSCNESEVNMDLENNVFPVIEQSFAYGFTCLAMRSDAGGSKLMSVVLNVVLIIVCVLLMFLICYFLIWYPWRPL